MPYFLLALLGVILLFWLILKLKEADRKTLEMSFRITLTLLLVLFATYSILTQKIGMVAAAALGLIFLYGPRVTKSFRTAQKKYLPKELTREKAAQILDVPLDASEDAIQEAYHRLIAKNHPDQGGSTYIAQQLNEARDLLLSKQKKKG